MADQGNAPGKPGEAGSVVSLAPQWLNDGARGGAPGWRAPAAAIKQAPSRFDTGGGQRWREEGERAPMQRAGSSRWTGAEPERWGEGGGAGRGYAESFGPGATGDRWGGGGGGGDALGRGRGRPSEVDSWKPRGDGTDWRAPGDPGAAAQPRTDWRSDRWGGAPGAMRADSWRAGGVGGGGRGFTDLPMDSGRGFGMGRGRGGAGLRAGGSFSSLRAGGGGIGGTAKLGRSRALYRYSTDELSRLYRQLLYAGRLKLPAGVEKDDPLLFLADGEFVDVMEQFIGTDPAEAAQAFTAHYQSLERQYSNRPFGAPRPEGDVLTPAPSAGEPLAGAAAPAKDAAAPTAAPAGAAPAAGAGAGLPDQWLYKDPQGIVQGPFPKQDIIDWYEGGFFPRDLPIRNANDSADAPFRPLDALLKIWATHSAPPGFPGAAPAPAQPEQQQQQQQPVAAAAAPALAENGHTLQLPDDLHLEDEDVLTAALKQMDIKPVPVAAAAAAAPAPSDPVVDPSLIKRIPSDKRLAALGAPAQPSAAPGVPAQPPAAPAPAPPMQQQGSMPLPYGAPGAGLPPAPATAAELEAFPFLQHHMQQQQQHPQHMAHHPLAAAGPGAFMGHPHSLGLHGPDAALLAHQHQHHLAPGQPLLPPQHAQQQQQQLGMPLQAHDLHAGSAWGHGAPHAVQHPGAAQQQQQQHLGSLSLAEIQREEQQKQAAEAARIAAAAQQHQQAAAAAGMHYEAPAPPAPNPQAPAPLAAKPAAAPASAPPQPAVEDAERVRPETKPAPWVAANAKPSGSSKSLLEIQEEEARQAAWAAEQERLQQEQAAATGAAASPAPGSGWARAAASGLIGVVAKAKSLKQIQEEEMRQAAAAKAAAAAQQQQAAAAAARTGPTLGEVIDRQLSAVAPPPSKTVWGVSSAAPGKQPSLREVMQYEESAADLEGGAPSDYPLAALPPPVQQRAAAPPAQHAPAVVEAEEDELLFWDYGVPQAKAAAPAAPVVQAPAPQPVKPARWAAAAAAPAAAPVVPAAVAAPPPAKAANGPAAKPAAAVPKPRPAAPAPAPPAAPMPTPAPIAEPAPAASAAPGSTALAGAFREWCAAQMRQLTGSDDVTLCEFLLTVEANSEVAEYITMYMGNSPAASRFAAEFMKRKLAEAANTGKKGKKGKKGGAAAAAAPAVLAAAPAPAPYALAAPPAMVPPTTAPAGPVRAAPAPPPPAASAASSAALPPFAAAASTGVRAAPAPAPSEFPSLGAAVGKAASKKDSDWEKIPKAATGGKGKKKGKGQKLDSTLLGFGTGTNYSVLELPQ